MLSQAPLRPMRQPSWQAAHYIMPGGLSPPWPNVQARQLPPSSSRTGIYACAACPSQDVRDDELISVGRMVDDPLRSNTEEPNLVKAKQSNPARPTMPAPE